MTFGNGLVQYGWSTDRNRSSTDDPVKHNGKPPLRYPDLGDNPNVILILVIVLPFIFIVLLCALTYCCYRFKKRSKEGRVFDPSTDEYNMSPSMIINNHQYNPYVIEDTPPAYESILETKKIALEPETTRTTRAPTPSIVLTPLNGFNPTFSSPI